MNRTVDLLKYAWIGAAALLAAACSGPAEQSQTADPTSAATEDGGAQSVASNPFRNAYFGETHMHTS